MRLLVAATGPAGLEPVQEARAYVGLGAEILRHGSIGESKLAEATETARRFATQARALRAAHVELLVTAPGRQAENGDELVDALARATAAPVRALSAEDEGRLAYEGAVAWARRPAGTVAVCDLGGGSTELVVGSPPRAPHWNRSVDLGALRLTEAAFRNDPPSQREIAEARLIAGRAFAGFVPPRPDVALAVGGSARGLARIVGRTLDEDGLRAALRIATVRRAGKLAKVFGLDDERARVLPAGAIILAEVVRKLGVPLELARAGLREGAVAALLADAAAA